MTRPTPAGTRPRNSNDTAIITANVIGTAHAAGCANKAPGQPPVVSPTIVTTTAEIARTPPVTKPASAPTSVRPRHQIPRTSNGQNVAAATANARPTTAASPRCSLDRLNRYG